MAVWTASDGAAEIVSNSHVRRLLDSRMHRYDLVAVITHSGHSINEGYFIYVRFYCRYKC
jgi:uncharacterized UBP type Zn finger protein